MKKIGEGWQYTVFDMGNGRVSKKFHSLPRMYWAIFKTFSYFSDDPVYKIPRYAKSMKEKAINSLALLKETGIDPSWIGNPEFKDGLDFEQDKVVPLHDHLKNINPEDGKKAIDNFIIFNKKLLAKGVIDKSFNIGKNFGINKSGQVILTDLGELYTGDEIIKNQIKKRAWAKHYITDSIPHNLVDYFISEMDKNFL